MLPDRTDAAEDAFVEEWSRSDDTDALIEVITAAMDARRPRLGARLVGLLEDHVEITPGSPVDRARTAARLLLLQERPEDRSWSELEEAWRDARRVRMKRIRHRMRKRMNNEVSRMGRLGNRRRR